MQALADALRAEGSVVRSGGDWDSWDLQLRGGLLGGARLRMAIEEHGSGRQLLRVRSWPHAPWAAVLLGVLLAVVAALAVASNADAVTDTFAVLAGGLVLRVLYECGAATATVKRALQWPLGPAASNERSDTEPVRSFGVAV